MGEPVSKLWSYMVFILMMIVTFMVFILQFDRTFENNLTDRTMSFVNQCQTTGRISTTNYTKFTKYVYRHGNYRVKITHSSLRAYPEEERTPSGDYRYTGSSKLDYYNYDTKDILKEMFTPTESKDYVMNNGDLITVEVKRHSNTSMNILSFIFGTNMRDSIVVRYSGAIGNSNED